jgi:hypothetical protein
MSRNGVGRRLRRLVIAGIGLVLGASFEAAAAPIPACQGPGPQPTYVFDYFDAYLGDFFPLDAEVCEKIVKKAVAACHAAVSEASKCHQRLVRSSQKAGKTACGTEGDGKQDCIERLKILTEDIEDFYAGETEDAHEVCDTDFAEDLFDYCVTGIL